jgi:hypothetical protein
MHFGKNEPRQADDIERHAAHRLGERDGMAWWRWLLFACLARHEAAEEVYLRIPKARLTRYDVPVTISVADDHRRGGRGRLGQHLMFRKPAKQIRRSIVARIAAWIGRAS